LVLIRIADKAGDAQPEREGDKSREHLINPQHRRHDRKNQRETQPGADAAQQRQRRIAAG
jgi:hypothetical protein